MDNRKTRAGCLFSGRSRAASPCLPFRYEPSDSPFKWTFIRPFTAFWPKSSPNSSSGSLTESVIVIATVRIWLELYFQTQLQDSRWVDRGCNPAEGAVPDSGIGQAELRRVEQIKKLGPE